MGSVPAEEGLGLQLYSSSVWNFLTCFAGVACVFDFFPR